jgi:hypothetical protein
LKIDAYQLCPCVQQACQGTERVATLLVPERARYFLQNPIWSRARRPIRHESRLRPLCLQRHRGRAPGCLRRQRPQDIRHFSHPHFVRVSALRGDHRSRSSRISFRSQANHDRAAAIVCAVAAEDITLPMGKMIRAYYGFRYHRIRRTTIVVGTGSEVSRHMTRKPVT